MLGEASSYQGGYERPNADEAARIATRHGASEEEHGLFSSVLSNLLHKDDDDDDAPTKKPVNADEVEHAAQAHDKIYSQNGGEPNEQSSSRDLGSAAALQAFKMFSGGGGSSGGSSNELIGMAMGEAMKLFNAQSGKTGGGSNVDQAEMLQNAAMMAMKLYMTHQSSQSNSGGSSSGGIGALMGMLGGGHQNQSSSGGLASSLLSKLL
ncbi:uncharacterized protein BYT42DRAFT_563060 [Radiomyces spectabilis]|uniref:uncharacterized protein n=1 Tax=Radiomyces spectabilis TaxID=64574 RepID=UPI00221E3C46|nr:uncharacterized protein BYT42DRAFT_563060 [Radiomyces spectabilis]KAI8384606.1 hypothetical protein BYT42DRAFT_563060 [Radiomyces spectabilis]